MARKDHDGGLDNPAFSTADEEGPIDDSISNSSTKMEGKKAKKKKTNEETLPPVSLFALFRFASCSDIVLILVASVAAVGTGVGMPLMLILFGDLTNSFVGNGLNSTMINLIRCNASLLPPDFK